MFRIYYQSRQIFKDAVYTKDAINRQTLNGARLVAIGDKQETMCNFVSENTCFITSLVKGLQGNEKMLQVMFNVVQKYSDVLAVNLMLLASDSFHLDKICNKNSLFRNLELFSLHLSNLRKVPRYGFISLS